jgi:predicted TIM-barrel fold metal-dependent hydrolase
MIVDCHTHIWQDPSQLGMGAQELLRRQAGKGALDASARRHFEASQAAEKTLVLGFSSRYLQAEVPNDLIAEYVRSSEGRMIGIASVDPTEDDALDQAQQLLEDPCFGGLTVSPALQNFHPADSRAMQLYGLAEEHGVPLMILQSTHFPRQGRMEHARPFLLDEIAREFPQLTMVISSLGHPWIEECIALVGKHPRVFCDVAGLVRRPWQAYNALVLAHQFHVMDKVLFGSDFPYGTAAEAIEAIYRLHEVIQGTNLPGVPREILRSMVERDSLAVLGIAQGHQQPVGSDAQPTHSEVQPDTE